MEVKKHVAKKSAKVAHDKKAAQNYLPPCACGGTRVWGQVLDGRPRMMRVCLKCGKRD